MANKKIYNEIVLIWNDKTNQYDTLYEDSYDYDGEIYQMAEAEIEVTGGKSAKKAIKTLTSAFNKLNHQFTVSSELGEDLDHVLKKMASSAKFLEMSEHGLTPTQKQLINLWRVQFGVLEKQKKQRAAIAQQYKAQAQREALDMHKWREDAKKEQQRRKQLIAQKKNEAQQTKKFLAQRKKQAQIEERAKIKLLEMNATLKKYNVTIHQVGHGTNLVAQATRGNAQALSQLNVKMKHAIATGKIQNSTLKLTQVRNHRNAMSLSRVRSQLLMASFAYTVTAQKAIQLVKAYAFQEQQEAKLLQALKSTNFAAGLSQKTIVEYAEAMEEATGIGDELTIGSSALLATFTKIGEQTFLRAQEAILDVTSAMYGANVSSETLKTTTVQVGKALNDPIKGINALSRVGIQFTDDQRSMIKEMVRVGDVAGAQKIILGELETQFGGMAKAMRSTTEGRINAMGAAFGTLAEEIGRVLAPAMEFVIEKLTSFAKSMDPAKIARYAIALGTILPVYVLYTKATVLAAKATKSMTLQQAALQFVMSKGKSAALLLGAAAAVKTLEVAMSGFDVGEGFNERVKELNDNIEKIGDPDAIDGIENLGVAMGRTGEEIEKAQEALQKQWDLLKAEGDIMATYAINQGIALDELSPKEENMIRLLDLKRKAMEEYKKELDATNKIEADRQSSLDTLGIALAKNAGWTEKKIFQAQTENELMKKFGVIDKEILQNKMDTFDVDQERIKNKEIDNQSQQRNNELVQIGIDIGREGLGFWKDDIKQRQAELDVEMQADIERVKQTMEYKIAAKTGNDAAMENLEKNARKKTLKDRQAAFAEQQKAAGAEIILNTSVAIMRALKDYTAIGAGPIIAMITALGAAQLARVATQQGPKFAKGGDFVTSGPQNIIVGDNPGGRERVQVTPLSSPNVNGPQQMGNINVTFTGNVMSQEFIEDQAIPQIKEAIRRGADIGI